MKNKVNITICGMEYTIIAEESDEYVKKVGQAVNHKMVELINENPKMSTNMAAVLTAVNLCDELFKAQQTADNLRTQLKKYLDDSSKSRQEAEESKREVMQLKGEIQDLKVLLAKLDEQTTIDL
jgi:cell division protein ZapA (FtsZ GTPase activity inhibitor)